MKNQGLMSNDTIPWMLTYANALVPWILICFILYVVDVVEVTCWSADSMICEMENIKNYKRG